MTSVNTTLGDHAARVAGLTTEGTILGTLSYMAPEQIDGREIDTRADVFAFGAVLFEMLTGMKAFEGESPARVMSAILRDEPARVSSIVPVTPAALEALIHACLAKDPNERWQNISDVARQLRHLRDMMSGPKSGALSASGALPASGAMSASGALPASAVRPEPAKARRNFAAYAGWAAAAVFAAAAAGLLVTRTRTSEHTSHCPAGAARADPPTRGHVSHRHAGAVARRPPARVRRRRSDRPQTSVGPRAGCEDAAIDRQHRRRERAVLVAGRAADRVFRRRQAQSRRRERRLGHRDLSDRHDRRRQLEWRGCDRLRATGRPDDARRGQRRTSRAVDDVRSQSRGDASPVSRVPAGRPALHLLRQQP